jgi:hypothetical protein
MGQERCMRFVSATGVSHILYCKSSEFVFTSVGWGSPVGHVTKSMPGKNRLETNLISMRHYAGLLINCNYYFQDRTIKWYHDIFIFITHTGGRRWVCYYCLYTLHLKTPSRGHDHFLQNFLYPSCKITIADNLYGQQSIVKCIRTQFNSRPPQWRDPVHELRDVTHKN